MARLVPRLVLWCACVLGLGTLPPTPPRLLHARFPPAPQEIDYRLEGANADRFRTNFAGTPWVKVPRVLWDYSASTVLTMEYTPGVKINRGEGRGI